MNRIVAIVTIAVVAVTTATAQRRGRIIIRPQTPPVTGPGRHYQDVDYPTPEKRAANLTELLALTDDQRQKVLTLFIDQDKQNAALWADESLTVEVRTKKISDIRASVTRTIRDLLTDEQKKKYDALATGDKPAEKIRLQPDPRG